MKSASLPVVLATASVTVAIGVTLGALGGYIGPKNDASAAPVDPPAPVMLVPATTQPQATPEPPPPEPEPMFASYRKHHEKHERHHEEHDEDER